MPSGPLHNHSRGENPYSCLLVISYYTDVKFPEATGQRVASIKALYFTQLTSKANNYHLTDALKDNYSSIAMHRKKLTVSLLMLIILSCNSILSNFNIRSISLYFNI